MSRAIKVQIVSVPWNEPQVSQKEINIFDKMKEATEDEEWKKIFENASQGVLRTGFKIKGRYLMYVEKGKQKHNKILLSEDPQEAIHQCQAFMRDHGGVRTNIEKTNEKNKPVSTLKWEKIYRLDNARNFHLTRYGTKLAEKMKLDQSSRTQLIHRLKELVSQPKFAHERVVFNNYQIETIEGIKVEKNGQIIDNMNTVKKTEIKYEPVVFQDAQTNGINYSNHWYKYLDKRHYMKQSSPNKVLEGSDTSIEAISSNL